MFGPPNGVPKVPDQFDVELVDHALLEELQLAADLMAAANQSDASLSLAEIDRILGVSGSPPGTQQRAPGHAPGPDPSDVADDVGPGASRQVGQVQVPRPRDGRDDVGQQRA